MFILICTEKLVLFCSLAAASVPEPVAIYPLNAKYTTREIKNRQPQGKPVGVSLAPGRDGEPGGSYQFAGTAESYIEFPNNGGLDVKHSITMLCWVYPESKDGPLFQYFTTDPKLWGMLSRIFKGKLLKIQLLSFLFNVVKPQPKIKKSNVTKHTQAKRK